jgi:hypothetical protein
MQDNSLFDLSALAVDSISVLDGSAEGHGMTELSASACSCGTCSTCIRSTPSFIEDEAL